MARARRVLVVEDEWILAAEIEDALQAAGCEVVGPVSTVRSALRLLEDGAVDAAVLDVNLTHEQSFPVAERLIANNTPFVFVSGFTQADLPERFRGCTLLAKPVSSAKILASLRLMTGP